MRNPSARTRRDDVANLINFGRQNPVPFIEQITQSQLWSMQRQITEATFSDYSRVIVKACHASGKTAVAGRIVTGFFYANPFCKILTTAPTFIAVEKLLWSEIGGVYERLPKDLGGSLFGTELRGAKNWYALGLSTDHAERFQGHHANDVLIVFDEAPGVRSEIWEAAESIRSGGNVRWLVIGNPTIPSGPFYERFVRDNAWKKFTISAFDTPNFEGVSLERLLEMSEEELMTNPLPYLITRKWVYDMYYEWGPDSPLWESRVLGRFPKNVSGLVFPLSLIEDARGEEPKDPDWEEKGPWRAGIDPAGSGGDLTAITVRCGDHIVETQYWADDDPRGEACAMLAKYKDKPGGLACVCDTIGLGHYFAAHLRDQGFHVSGAIVGERSTFPERYRNLKAELYFSFRERLESGQITGLTDDKMIAQLAEIKWKYNTRGQVEIEDKDKTRSRTGASPDVGESAVLAYASAERLQLDPVDIKNEILFIGRSGLKTEANATLYQDPRPEEKAPSVGQEG